MLRKLYIKEYSRKVLLPTSKIETLIVWNTIRNNQYIRTYYQTHSSKMNVMNLLGRITEDIMGLEVMESHSEILVVRDAPVYELDVTEINRAYDALLESTMELFHDTQERRREYNRAIRESRHLNRLAAQRERAQQARAVAQNTVNLAVPAPRVQPVNRVFPVTGLTKLKTKALKNS